MRGVRRPADPWNRLVRGSEACPYPGGDEEERERVCHARTCGCVVSVLAACMDAAASALGRRFRRQANEYTRVKWDFAGGGAHDARGLVNAGGSVGGVHSVTPGARVSNRAAELSLAPRLQKAIRQSRNAQTSTVCA